MSWSCPFHAVQPPLMSLTFSRYVRFIFHVCPVLSSRVISLHLPSCRLVSLCVVSSCFPFLPPALPCFQFCPSAFLSCRLPISSLISLHFLAFPLCSPIFPAKKHGFPAFSQLGRPDFRQKEAGTPTQQRAGRGNRAWDPCFPTPAPRRLLLVERHQIAARCLTSGGGGGYPLSSLRCPTRRAMSADIRLIRAGHVLFGHVVRCPRNPFCGYGIPDAWLWGDLSSRVSDKSETIYLVR